MFAHPSQRSTGRVGLLSVVASKVIVGHGLAFVVVFAQLLRLLQQLKGSLELLVLHQIDRDHVANVTYLQGSFGVLKSGQSLR